MGFHKLYAPVCDNMEIVIKVYTRLRKFKSAHHCVIIYKLLKEFILNYTSSSLHISVWNLEIVIRVYTRLSGFKFEICHARYLCLN